MITVRNIVKNYLVGYGYDGLSNYECGCDLSDLCCCCDNVSECEPAYKHLCDKCKEHCEYWEQVGWCMKPEKQED